MILGLHVVLIDPFKAWDFYGTNAFFPKRNPATGSNLFLMPV